MRKLLLITLIFALPACALLDSFLPTKQQQASDDNGQLLYIDSSGQTTTSINDVITGQPNKPLNIELLEAPPQAGQWTKQLGPWGGVAGGLLALLGGIYARMQNRKRLREAGMRRQAEVELDLSKQSAEFLAKLIEQIKEGEAVDLDADGRVSLSEIKMWVRSQGRRFHDPKLLAKLLKTIELRH